MAIPVPLQRKRLPWGDRRAIRLYFETAATLRYEEMSCAGAQGDPNGAPLMTAERLEATLPSSSSGTGAPPESTSPAFSAHDAIAHRAGRAIAWTQDRMVMNSS